MGSLLGFGGNRQWEMGLWGSFAVDVDGDRMRPTEGQSGGHQLLTADRKGSGGVRTRWEHWKPSPCRKSTTKSHLTPPPAVPCVSPHVPSCWAIALTPPSPCPHSNVLPLLGLGFVGCFLRTFIKISLLKGKMGSPFLLPSRAALTPFPSYKNTQERGFFSA